jgi:hypothetical protein
MAQAQRVGLRSAASDLAGGLQARFFHELVASDGKPLPTGPWERSHFRENRGGGAGGGGGGAR